METKVWNDLFAQFAAEHQEISGEWNNGWAESPDKLPDKKLNGRWPVLKVSCRDAFLFAQWLGGRLPTEDQWKRAAGCYEGQQGPTSGATDDQPATDESGVSYARIQTGPLPVGVAQRDRSPFGCRDMAGNGREWTRTGKYPIPGPIDKAPDRNTGQTMITCGRSFYASESLRFHDSDSYIKKEFEFNPAQPFDERYYEISFRVIFDSPP
jgi:formylglycine-generating enzyme required for sulfatase activity